MAGHGLFPGDLHQSLRPMVAALQAGTLHASHSPIHTPRPIQPFVTISRQAGAAGIVLAQKLVERLNALDPNSNHPWTAWDRELVEKVSEDHHLSADLISALTETSRNWVNQFFGDMALMLDSTRPDDAKIYRRVAMTVRALAQAGRVVIVGRGGAFITRDMPGGLHVRLVAPLEHRIQSMAQRENLTRAAAAAKVRQLDAGRESFYRHYFSGISFAPENFAATLNTSVLDEARLVECLLALVTPMVPADTTER